MKVLALGHDVVAQDDPRFAELRPAEARRVWEMYQADLLREVAILTLLLILYLSSISQVLSFN